MTKKEPEKKGTEQRIVEKALDLFNETGIEYVGMRELAAALDMRIGNVTYYFPTKDDLVDRLSRDLAELNNRTIVAVDQMTITEFVAMMNHVFHNHTRYRCLMLSFVHVMERNPLISKRYNKIQKNRKNTWAMNVQALQRSGAIKTTGEQEIQFLVATISFIARFWISEAAISNRDTPESEQARHYINMVLRIFLPFATEKGKKEITGFLNDH